MTKLIRNKKFTRITALLLVVAVIFGTMFSLPVSAASGDKVQLPLITVMTAPGTQSNSSRPQSATVIL